MNVLLSYSSEVRSLKWVFRTAFLLKILGENSFSHFFQFLEVIYIPWLQAPSSICKASNAELFSDLMLPCSQTGPIWIIQDNLPISKKKKKNIVNLITFAKFLLLCKLTHSEVPRIRMWKSLRGHYSVYHG